MYINLTNNRLKTLNCIDIRLYKVDLCSHLNLEDYKEWEWLKKSYAIKISKFGDKCYQQKCF